MSETKMSSNRRVVRCPHCYQGLYVVPAAQTASRSPQLCPFCEGQCNFELTKGEVSDRLPRLIAKDEPDPPAEVQLERLEKSIPNRLLESERLHKRIHQQRESSSATINLAASCFLLLFALNSIDENFP